MAHRIYLPILDDLLNPRFHRFTPSRKLLYLRSKMRFQLIVSRLYFENILLKLHIGFLECKYRLDVFIHKLLGFDVNPPNEKS